MKSMKIFLSLLLISFLLGCGEAKEKATPHQTPAELQKSATTAEAGKEKATAAEMAKAKALAEKQAAEEKAKADLAKFKVTDARFYKSQEAYLGKRQPRMEMTFKNGTDKSVERVYFIGTLSKADGSAVFLQEGLSHKFTKGLAPGEERKEDFGLNMYSPWATVDVPEETLFTVKVVKLEGGGEANHP